MLGDTAKDIAQIGFRVEAVELGGFDKGVDGSGALATGIGAGEQVVLAAEGEGPDGALGSVVADLQAAIIEIAGQCLPAAAGAAHGAGQLALARELGQRGVEEGGKLIDHRAGPRVADLSARFGQETVDLALDIEEPADALARLGGNGRLRGQMDVVDLAPDMRPACVRISPGRISPGKEDDVARNFSM